jgi:hypothetical protein
MKLDFLNWSFVSSGTPRTRTGARTSTSAIPSSSTSTSSTSTPELPPDPLPDTKLYPNQTKTNLCIIDAATTATTHFQLHITIHNTADATTMYRYQYYFYDMPEI